MADPVPFDQDAERGPQEEEIDALWVAGSEESRAALAEADVLRAELDAYVADVTAALPELGCPAR